MSEQAEAKKSSKRSFPSRIFIGFNFLFVEEKFFFLKIGAKFFFREREEKKSFVVISFPFVAHREKCSRKIVGGELYLLSINFALKSASNKFVCDAMVKNLNQSKIL